MNDTWYEEVEPSESLTQLTVRAFFLEFRKLQHIEFGLLIRFDGFWAKLTADSPSNLQVRAGRHHKH